MNILDSFRRFLFTHLDLCAFTMEKCNATFKTISNNMRQFHGYHCSDVDTYIKMGGSFKKYSKFTPTIRINSNFYSFRIMFIIIIVRFFIICFINSWKYEKEATNWDRVTNWCVYLKSIFINYQRIQVLAQENHYRPVAELAFSH